MGMDLSKYEVAEGNEEVFIGINLSKESLDFFHNFKIKSTVDVEMEEVVQVVEDKFKINFKDIYNYNFTIEEEKSYIFVLKDKYLKELKNIEKEYDKKVSAEDEAKHDELFNKYEAIALSVDIVDQKVENEFGYVYIFTNKFLPKETKYYIVGDVKEIMSYRKPFRDIKKQSSNINEEGDFSFFTNDFSGTNESDFDILMNKINADKEISIGAFTNEHNAKKEFLDCVSEDNKDDLKRFFPLKENEFIRFDY